MTRKHESGQALVLVLLSLSVVLTLVLFILSRSVTDVSVSSDQSDSVRAFSAAEAGVEQALVTGSTSILTPAGFQNGNATYTTSVTDYAKGLTEFVYPFLLSSGDSGTVWFLGHDTNGGLITTGAFNGSKMKICWGSGAASASSPAIEVSIYYESGSLSLTNFSTLKIARAVYDPYYLSRTPPDNFLGPDAGSCPVAGKTYAFQKTITFSGFSPAVNTGGLIFAKVRMFYNSTPQDFGVSVAGPGNALPSQAKEIDSKGLAGGSNRRIVVYQGWGEFPFASNSILTPSDITE
jgi:Tfp pilus assembly protein PilX